MSTRLLILAAALAPAMAACRSDAAPTAPSSEAPRPTAVVAALAFWQVSADHEHTCGVTGDNRAYCWGENVYGALGDGTTVTRLRPVAVATARRFRQVSAGSYFSCGVTIEYRAFCWGANTAGYLLADGTTTDQWTPVAVVGGHQFRQLDAGLEHTCGVTYPDNRVFCWGVNTYGQLGDGTRTHRSRPVAIRSTLAFRQVTVGYYHSCAVTTDNWVYCWGRNQYGQLGDGTAEFRRLTPARIAGVRRFRQVDAGGGHTCAVTTAYQAFCWGFGKDGSLGTGDTAQSALPRAVAGGIAFSRVTAGGDHTCGENIANQAWCWGFNRFGGLGDGTTVRRLRPAAVAGGLAFAQVSAGVYYSCGKTTAGVGYCWGENYGRLGDGTTANRRVPVAIAAP